MSERSHSFERVGPISTSPISRRRSSPWSFRRCRSFLPVGCCSPRASSMACWGFQRSRSSALFSKIGFDPRTLLIALCALACTEPFLWGTSLARNDALPMVLLAGATPLSRSLLARGKTNFPPRGRRPSPGACDVGKNQCRPPFGRSVRRLPPSLTKAWSKSTDRPWCRARCRPSPELHLRAHAGTGFASTSLPTAWRHRPSGGRRSAAPTCSNSHTEWFVWFASAQKG